MDKFNEHGGGDETVKNVYDEMTGWEHHTWMSSTDHEYIESLATRALAAHNREMAAKDAERKIVADNYEAVIRAKDAEIAALNEKLTLHDCYADEESEDADAARICAEDEASRLRALVKEMLSHIEELYQCQFPCDRRCLRKKESCEFRARHELIVKARKVVK